MATALVVMVAATFLGTAGLGGWNRAAAAPDVSSPLTSGKVDTTDDPQSVTITHPTGKAVSHWSIEYASCMTTPDETGDTDGSESPGDTGTGGGIGDSGAGDRQTTAPDAEGAESAALSDGGGAARLVLVTCTDWDGSRYLSNVVVVARPSRGKLPNGTAPSETAPQGTVRDPSVG